MNVSAHEVNKMSKGDPKITDYFNGLFATISKQSEHIEQLTERIDKQSIIIDEQVRQIDIQDKQERRT